MKPFFKNFGSFFVLFLAAFLLVEMPQTFYASKSNGIFIGVVQAIPKVNQANLVQACLRGNKIICRGITKKTDDQSNKFTQVKIHGKKYNLTNYSENDIFLPMKTQHEWERVICAASQGDKIGIDCSDTNEFGGPSMGFLHSNGREAADPFHGKDLNTFEYQKSTEPSLGIKIDLIADWVVTQARGCPSGCGNSARNFSGSVRCSTGDDADCDPSTKPAIPTRSCGKTADCPTYTGTWIKGSCPSGCGHSTGYKTVSVSCSGGNCNPSARPSTSRWCQATPPCVVNCQVSGWSSWTDIGDGSWGSCSKSCGGGTQTKDQERERTITTQPQNGGRACPHLRETQSVSRSCNMQACPCGIDLYKKDGSCVSVGNGRYSPSNNDSRYNCSGKPANSSWTSSGGGSNNCSWSCNSGYSKNSSSTACVPDPVNCPPNPPSNASWLAGHGNTQPNCSWSCNAGRIWKDGSCKTTGPYTFGSCPSSHGYGGGTINGTCGFDSCTPPSTKSCAPVCSGGSSWNGSSCVCPAGKIWNGSRCEEETFECQNSCPPYVANGRYTQAAYPNCGCSLRCNSGYRKSGNTCTPIIAPSYYEFVCDSGAWTYAGRCGVLDDCDHEHSLGERCCTASSSSPEGVCRSGGSPSPSGGGGVGGAPIEPPRAKEAEAR